MVSKLLVLGNVKQIFVVEGGQKRTDRVRCEEFPVTAYGVGFVSDIQAGVGKNCPEKGFFLLPVDVFADFYLRRAAVKKNPAVRSVADSRRKRARKRLPPTMASM